MDLNNITTLDLITLIREKKVSCVEVTKHYLDNIEKYKEKNAVLEVFDDVLARAEELDNKIANGENIPNLCGVPILIKDNILYQGKICSNASKFMENYVASYNATVIKKLLDEGVIILGRTNMD